MPKSTNSSISRLATFFALATALTSPAMAQEAPAEEESGIRDIIVTAQRRSESIQSVPVAVTAIDAKALSQSSIDDIRDFAGRVPSLVVDSVNAGPSAAAISIRGISFEDIEKSFDPAVGVAVDGVFIGTNTGQLLDAFDLESIEVLRGPQGTLFGRNTIGGVINVRRSKPTGEFGVKGSFGYADFDTLRGRLVVNSPEIAGLLSLKGFFAYDKTDGYLFNVTQNRRYGKDKTVSGGITAQIKPNDNINAVITYERSEQDGEFATASTSVTGTDLICLQVPTPGGPIRAFGIPNEQCDRGTRGKSLYRIFANIPTPLTNDVDSVTGEVNVKLGTFDLVSITGWQQNKESVVSDFDSSSINFFDTLRNQKYDQFSQEVRIVGDVTDSVNLLVGAYYFDSEYKLFQTSNLGFVPATLSQTSGVKSRSYAGFSDVRFKVTDRLTLGAGGRYTRDRKSIFNNFGQVIPLVQLSIPTFNAAFGDCVGVIGLIAPGVPRFGPANNCTGKKSFGKFTWRALADYKVGDNKLLYASYSKGFRSGGFNGRAGSPSSLGPYDPETVNAYEVGLKADWLDRRLRTNIALFRTDYKNKQEEVVQASPPGSANPQETVVRNAASARINGAEIEITAQPSDELTVFASLSYLDAEYKNFFRDVNGDLIPDDVSTLNLRRAPPVSWSFGFDYAREIGKGTFSLSPTFRFIDKLTTCIVADTPPVLGSVRNDVRCTPDAREILDVTTAYKLNVGAGEVKFSLFVRNLLDDRGISSTLPVAGLFTFSGVRPPRQFGGEISFKF